MVSCTVLVIFFVNYTQLKQPLEESEDETKFPDIKMSETSKKDKG